MRVGEENNIADDKLLAISKDFTHHHHQLVTDELMVCPCT